MDHPQMKTLIHKTLLLCIIPLGLLMLLSGSHDAFKEWCSEWLDLWKGGIDDHTDGIEL